MSHLIWMCQPSPGPKGPLREVPGEAYLKDGQLLPLVGAKTLFDVPSQSGWCGVGHSSVLHRAAVARYLTFSPYRPTASANSPNFNPRGECGSRIPHATGLPWLRVVAVIRCLPNSRIVVVVRTDACHSACAVPAWPWRVLDGCKALWTPADLRTLKPFACTKRAGSV